MPEPRVSVLVTAYNREQFLGAAIESALASTMTDLEVIVVDDCSQDATWEIAQEYARRDRRVRAYRNDTNLGDNPNRNRAASYARGHYLKYLDSDDLLYPHALGVLVAAMDAFPEAGFGLSEVPDVAGPCPRRLSPREAYREHFFDQDLFGRAPGSSIISRAAFEAVGGFREFTGRGQLGDLELWLRLARRFDLVRLPRDLVWDRYHGGQESAYQRRAPHWRARVERELHLEALAAPDCPLTLEERALAVQRLHELAAREVLRRVMLRGEVYEANRYRKAVSVPVSAIVRSLLRRVTRAGAAW
jgi:glycosyltransferase involved in cell wall biosynthesis